jgi:membrane-associated phospholipid phosphatase
MGAKTSRHVPTAGRPAAEPLLPGGARPAAVAATAACVLVVAIEAVWLRHGMETSGADTAVDTRVRAALAGHRLLLAVLVWAGEPVPVTIMTAALCLGCLLRHRYGQAALVGIAVPLAAAVTELVLKPVIGRTPWGNPFPSGHVTCTAAMATALTVLLASAPRTVAGLPRAALAGTAFVVTAAVAVGVIGANMHHFADTIAGAAVGAGTVLVTALALDALGSRLSQARAGARLRPGTQGISELAGRITGLLAGDRGTLVAANARPGH